MANSTIAEKIAQAETERKRIAANIAAAYTEAEAKGATMPQGQGSANLADTVASIPEAVQPTLITKQITENGTYSAEDETPPADGYSEVTVDVTSPMIKLADIHPDQVTNSFEAYIENVANPDDNHIFIIMCNEHESLVPQSNYAVFFNIVQNITVNGVQTTAMTNAMLRPNGTIGACSPNFTLSNHNLHWSDQYAYLFPDYTYSIYLINLGNNSSTPQRKFVDETTQKAAAFDYLTGRSGDSDE